MRILPLLYFFSNVLLSTAQNNIKILYKDTALSLRGLSVVNDSVIWASGTKGIVMKSINYGKTWRTYQVLNHDNFDFRDIEAFDTSNAVVMGSGSPAHFLRTSDGGANWQLVYINKSPSIFFNALDFWDKLHGIAFSDPINGKLFLIETFDGGITWKDIPQHECPSVPDSVAGFAASGSSMICTQGGGVMIGTGGNHSFLLLGSDYGKTWSRYETPVIHGKPSTGIFSVWFDGPSAGFTIGGDYSNPGNSMNNLYYTTDKGLRWNKPVISPKGYKSCIIRVNKKMLITTGPSGTDYSVDNGKTFKTLDGTGFHVCSKAEGAKRVYFAGSKGKIGVWIIK